MPSSLKPVPPPAGCEPQEPLLIGVDAGGTKTRATLAQAGPQGRFCVLGRGEAGPGNPLSSGAEVAQQAIAKAVSLACQGNPNATESAVLAIAGCHDQTVAQTMYDWAVSQNLAVRCQIVTDFEPLLAAVSPTGPAVGVIAGTGSVAFARDNQGVIHRRGGLGYLLGDEGSGYAIGRRAIIEVLQGDAAEQSAHLAELVGTGLHISDCCQAPAAVHAAANPRQLIASLAKPVVHAAGADPQARKIVAEELTYLARTVASVVEAAGLSGNTFPLGMGGSVLLGSEQAQKLLIDAVIATGVGTPQAQPVHDVLAGCLQLASKSEQV